MKIQMMMRIIQRHKHKPLETTNCLGIGLEELENKDSILNLVKGKEPHKKRGREKNQKRTLKALRAQGKIINTCEVKMAENPRALREYFTPNTYNSPIGNRLPEIESNNNETK
ncbi:hypothetical protein M9H77_31355 [Catharanthus roseus]|uniref:Uncharacterized protein n=1 Tax=Catharanthus roseus TaxID=4058 RepID=A0ACC0A271_CATRO|nr:hypothetical protein M9H77_31355 [Catharanthus roseus]